jgi:hypothetical protein
MRSQAHLISLVVCFCLDFSKPGSQSVDFSLPLRLAKDLIELV